MEIMVIVMPIAVMWIRLERKIGNIEGRLNSIWSIFMKSDIINKGEGIKR